MLSKILLWWISFKSRFNFSLIKTPLDTSATSQESSRDIEARKRVKKAFEEQQSAMNARAMKAHDPSCVDPLTCKKRKCFKFAPDKIVSDPYEVKK